MILGHFASSGGDDTYTVYHDHPSNPGLSCNCPGWSRQTHYRDCPAGRGYTCTCRARAAVGGRSTPEKDMRTCKHLREVQQRIVAAGGLAGALELVRRGITLGDDPEAAFVGTRWSRRPARQSAPARPARSIIRPAPPAPAARPARPQHDRALRIRDDDE